MTQKLWKGVWGKLFSKSFPRRVLRIPRILRVPRNPNLYPTISSKEKKHGADTEHFRIY